MKEQNTAYRNTRADNTLPFACDEFERAKQQAHHRMLQNLIRLAAWEALPYPAITLGDRKQIQGMPMWLSRKVATWLCGGDEHDLFAPITVEDAELSSLSHWLAIWAAEGLDKEALTRFHGELLDSQTNEALALCFRDRWNSRLAKAVGDNGFWKGLRQLPEFRENPALFFEQWGAVGHPIHPTIKAKPGVSVAEVFRTAPEFRGRARLTVAAVGRDYCVLEGGDPQHYLAMFARYFPDQFTQWKTALGNKADACLPLPVHPVQLESRWARPLERGLLLPDKAPNIDSFASLSYRTVYPAGGADKPFIKLPVAMRMTSVQRTVSPRSCQMGPRVSRLLADIARRDNAIGQVFKSLPETWGLHLDAPADTAKHFSAIFRAPLTEVLATGETAVPVAALMAKTPARKSLAAHILTADRFGMDRLMPQFRVYVRQLLTGVLGLYLKYGITLEAHQQNSFLVVTADDTPNGFVIRDFGGVRIHPQSLREKGLELQFHSDPLIKAKQRHQCRQKLIHTLFICHLGALVSALTGDFSCPSAWLWRIVAEEATAVFEDCRPAMNVADHTEDLQQLLYKPWATKAFITMRLRDTGDDIWTQIPNPLSPFV